MMPQWKIDFMKLVDACQSIPREISTSNMLLSWNPHQGHWSAIFGDFKVLVTWVRNAELFGRHTLIDPQHDVYVHLLSNHEYPYVFYYGDSIGPVNFDIDMLRVDFKLFRQPDDVEKVLTLHDVTRMDGPWFEFLEEEVASAKERVEKVISVNPTNKKETEHAYLNALFHRDPLGP